MIIGITGGIGSGKSTVSEKLRAMGYPVYDSDTEAHRLQNEHPEIRKQLTNRFGDNIYTESGLNRAMLAGIVFNNIDSLRELNAIVHPVVLTDLHDWINANAGVRYLFVESAILFESGFSNFVDKILVVTAAEKIRIDRVIKRDGISPEQIKARMNQQLDEEIKLKQADFIINTDNGLGDEQIIRFFEELKIADKT